MAFDPSLERELTTSVRQARLVAFTCCFLAPIMYVFSFGTQVLHSRWILFLAGFNHLPWADPKLAAAVTVAALALWLSVILPPRLGRNSRGRSALGALRARNLVTSGLLVVVAISGLFLGIKLGPPVATLCLALFLVPMGRGWFVLPSEGKWRAALSQAPGGGE